MTTHITLPSNASHLEFPKNVNGDYRVRLTKPLELEGGSWEVGLTDIQYSKNWTNVPDSMFAVNSGGWKPLDRAEIIQVPGRDYATVSELTRHLNSLAGESVGGKTVVFAYDLNAHRVKVTIHGRLPEAVDVPSMLNGLSVSYGAYARLTDRAGFSVDIRGGPVPTYVHIGLELAEILGFASPVITGSTTARNPPNLRRGFTSLYVYGDLVEDRHVGNTMAPLLRCVALNNGQAYQHVHKEFTNVHYHPVRNTLTDVIHVRICDHVGKTVDFDGGLVILGVALRRQRR